MAVLEWSEALALELPAMDEVHQEFVLMLAEVEAADDGQLCARWDELIAHTQVHFDQEDRWMQSTRFTSTNCHSLQHKVVLQVMRDLAEQHWTMVVVTHEIRFARQVADEVLFIDGGVVVERGAPEQVILDPQAERTRSFLQRILDPL